MTKKLARDEPTLFCSSCDSLMDQTRLNRNDGSVGTARCTADNCPEKDIVYTYEWPQIILTRIGPLKAFREEVK